MTLPRRQTSVTSAKIEIILVVFRIAKRSSLRIVYVVCLSRIGMRRILKPSAYAAMSPYSIPLCTIFTKWPAPGGPQCR